MKENKLYNSIKLVVVTSFFVTWIALFMGSYFYNPIGIKYGLNMTTVLLWAYLQLYNFLVSKYERREMDLYRYLVEEDGFNGSGDNQVDWGRVKEKISFETRFSRPYIDQVLSSMSTSILYVDKKMEVKLSNAFSLSEVFDEPRKGEKFLDYIYCNQIEEMEKDSLEYVLATLFGMPKLQWEILSKKLPSEIMKKDKKGESLSYRLHYIPHFNSTGLYLITVVIQDQSELVNDQKSLRYQSEDLKKFFSILSIQDSVFELFMDETSRIFKDLKRMVKIMNSQRDIDNSYIKNMLRLVHTLKANAGLFGFVSIQKVAHTTEKMLLDLEALGSETKESVIEMINNQIKALSEEIYSYTTLRREIFEFTHRREVEVEKYRLQWAKTILSQLDYHVRSGDLEKYELLFKQCFSAISNLEKVSLKDYLKRYDTMVSQIANEHDKKVATLDIDLGIHLFDKRILFHLNDIIVHALRNAVIHGIETTENRAKSGKNPHGRIKLKSYVDGDMICISVEDDGVGLNVDKIKESLLREGFSFTRLANMSDEEVLANLFKSNFSTYQKADLSAGRGIGLDIIRSYVQCLRGKVKLLQSESGMKIEISFPVDIEDVIQPNGFHQIASLLEDTLTSNFPKEKVHLTLHDKSLVEDMIMGHKLFLDEILKNISEYILKQPFVWEQLFVDVFKLNGKRKIDFDNVYRVVIGINGDGLFFDRDDVLISKAEYIARKLGGSLMYRGKGLIELNIPSGFKNGNSVYNFEVVALEKYHSTLSNGISKFFSKQVHGWTYNMEWVDKLSKARLKSEGRIILADMESLLGDRGSSLRKNDSLIVLNISDKELESLSQLNISPDQIFFYNTSEPDDLLTQVISDLLVKRFDKQLSSAITLEDYKLAS